MVAKFRATGQSCIAANRFLVQRSVLEAFTDRLVERVKHLKVGDGMTDGVEIGPLINREAVVRLQKQIADAVMRNARIILGGDELDPHECFFPPTVVSDVSPDMRLAREEIFGPVAAIMPFGTEAEAMRIANATRYGLASYLYSRDLERIVAFAERLEFGMVGVNCGSISSANVPFGGIKESGLGREGSSYGIDEYLSIKYVALAGLRS
jgi:succinate-semialdehyde dehydrogenase/glutarate-semialdehyde dehydrogenase